MHAPEGFNVGLNLGKVAGAGVEEHLHFHVVPRWSGDTNALAVMADVRVLFPSTCGRRSRGSSLTSTSPALKPRAGGGPLRTSRRLDMRKSKLIGWPLILGFLAVVIYQNEDHFLNTAQSLRLNVKAFPEYVSPVLPLAVFHLLFFVFGLAVAFVFSSINRFRLRRAFKRLNATVDAQQAEIQALKTELARVTGEPLPLPGDGAAAPPPGRPARRPHRPPTMNPSKTTPMLQQYLAIKEQYPDAILFYRMGDFYEMFFEDADTASRALEITLTSRNKNDDAPVPMCGVPYRAAAGYIARLIERGTRWPSATRWRTLPWPRGSCAARSCAWSRRAWSSNEELLDAKSQQLPAGPAPTTNPGPGLPGYLHRRPSAPPKPLKPRKLPKSWRVAPRELLLPKRARLAADHGPVLALCPVNPGRRPSTAPRSPAAHRTVPDPLPGRVRLPADDGAGLRGRRAAALRAETQKQARAHLAAIETYSLDDHLIIDAMSRRNLELVHNSRNGTRQGTLLGVLDQTVTAMGGAVAQAVAALPAA